MLSLEDRAGHADSVFSGSAFLGKGAFVTRSHIGRYFGLGCFSYVADSIVGDFCTFGSRVSVGAFSHPLNRLSVHEVAYRDTRKIYGDSIIEGDTYPERVTTTFGCDIWIGDNSVCRSGVNIEHGSVVGAGSVVTKNVPAYAIVAGNPARLIRFRFSEKIIQALLALRWWDMPIDQLKRVDFSNLEAAIDKLSSYRGI